MEDIEAEVKALAHMGYKEVVLTGIHISSYGIDFDEEEWKAKTKEYKDRVNAALYPEKPNFTRDAEKRGLVSSKNVGSKASLTICSECGETIEQRGKYCPNCGIRLPEQTPHVKFTQETRERKDINVPTSLQRKASGKQLDNNEKLLHKKNDDSIKQASRTNYKKKDYPISSREDDTSWGKVLITIILALILVVLLGGFAIGSLLKFLLF